MPLKTLTDEVLFVLTAIFDNITSRIAFERMVLDSSWLYSHFPYLFSQFPGSFSHIPWFASREMT